MIIIGSARSDSRGKLTGDIAGDQKQSVSVNDTKGEVSCQNFYNHKKGWVVIRPKSEYQASLIAKAMKRACDNKHIGYDQSNRTDILIYGTETEHDTECDCSSLVRQCIREATHVDAGNFTTANEKACLLKTGLFADCGIWTSGMPLYDGDILVTATKGHTAIVVDGDPRSAVLVYPVYTGASTSIVDALKAVGENNISMYHRKEIARKNGIDDYSGTKEQNEALLELLKAGRLNR